MDARLRFSQWSVHQARALSASLSLSLSLSLPLSFSAPPPLCGDTWFRVITRRRGAGKHIVRPQRVVRASRARSSRVGVYTRGCAVDPMMRTAIHPPKSNLGERVARAIRDCAFRSRPESSPISCSRSIFLVGNCKATLMTLLIDSVV